MELVLVVNDRAVKIRTAIAEELPRIADLADLIHVEVGDDQLILIACADGKHLPARIAEIALAVEFADIPRSLGANAVDGTDEVSVSDRVCRLFEFPEIFAQSRDGCRRIENYLGTIEAEASCTFRKVSVVADINSYPSDRRIKARIAKIARTKVKFLPESRCYVRDVRLAILAEILPSASITAAVL